MVVAAAGLLVGGCGGDNATSDQERESTLRAERAWNQLRGVMFDLSFLNTQTVTMFERSNELAEELGLDWQPNVVPWSEYEEIGRKLHRWERRHRGVGESWWHDLAQAGIKLSDAAVKYASANDAPSLRRLVAASKRVDAIIDTHCTEPFPGSLSLDCSQS